MGQGLPGHDQRELCQGAPPEPSLYPLPWEAAPTLHNQDSNPTQGPLQPKLVLVPKEGSIVSVILDVIKGGRGVEVKSRRG